MDRRQFLVTSTATFFSTLVANTISISSDYLPFDAEHWRPMDPLRSDGPAPIAEISAVVDVMVPPDPDIPGDFKGTDYNADWILAATLGDLGQIATKYFLNKYARRVAGAKFINCAPEDQLEAVKEWVRESDGMLTAFREMLTGVLTISIIGTYEENTEREQKVLFESMGWYDPDDEAGTFRLPNEGYPDARQFPVSSKKGLQK